MRNTLNISKAIAVFAIGFTTALPVQVHAEGAAITSEQAARKVNIAGRQRMLSQRIAKAACFTARDIAPTEYREQLVQARDLFEQSQDALRHGSLDLKLAPEIRPSVLLAQSEVIDSWATFRKPVDDILTQAKVDTDLVLSLQDHSLEVLDLANEAVFKTTQAYGGSTKDVSIALTVTVDVAGRQRMLSQKMMKEACLLGITDDKTAVANSLSETMRLFDASLTALRFGYANAGVLEAPNQDIASALETVSAHWEDIKPLFEKVAAGEVPSDDDLIDIEKRAETLLKDMNTAVGLYENI
ncbi:type IV pili methyl-accepting chemotaxis transducer N-terminal domain-containing protein [Parasulfitobacter algicola]|uniref:Type IV pili methyl-accepting chemotaxis transducer N-terminal domain-containing protein n=1 Tax=Parasulfitobacter algicola TaxID=2614809 RepID=A0ABX2IKD1_9RHOB|nr:type IV pili methyl-accepting chemotaxis transducer N-terminal domain-containing protein [Sulfitobacter algicola]NSX53342.1 type IV pili methyl-accepting chemotaxis transducer N-terminal domain-containing protein [Sulfitobacter algicola]